MTDRMIRYAFNKYSYLLFLLFHFAVLPSAADSVGTVDGKLTVSENGAAVYTVPLDIYPSGTGFDPQIGLVYNSQQLCYGNVGYGVSISGISSISRAGKDQFHDNAVQKVKYEAGDNYILDGKRLYLKSGIQGYDGSTYTVEGNPYATVTLHGSDYNANYSVWFELKDADGNVYHYDHRQRCYFGHPSKSYKNVAWYITLAKNKYDEEINYTYSQIDNVTYPSTITYGRTGERCMITLSYSNLGSPQPFVIEGGVVGYISKRLSSVVSDKDSEVYRHYLFSYSLFGDNSIKKYDRLTSVAVMNGNGDSLAPLTLNWNYLGEASVSNEIYNVTTQDLFSGAIDEGKSFYSSLDVNNDGVSDILRFWNGRERNYNTGNTESVFSLYISKSHVGADGSVSFQEPTYNYLIPCNDLSALFEMNLSNMYAGSGFCNLDGDSYNDIILPYIQTYGAQSYCYFFLVRGNGYSNSSTKTQLFPLSGSKTPLFGTVDLNGDGKDEIIYVETVRNGACFNGKILYNFASPIPLAEAINLSFTYSQNQNIEKMFLIDCNADGLQDILLLFKNGYKIYFYNGGSDLSGIYTEANTRVETNCSVMRNFWRMEQGDFNGDGLIDFVTCSSGESKLGFIFNNGDGTFTQSTKTNVDFYDQADSGKDDEWFAIRVADFDKDGLSDVMVSKKHLYDASHWYESTYYRQDKTQVRWFRSDGIKPVLWHSYDKMGNEERDCAEAYIFTGDFNGDGYVEIANYGSNLNSATDNTFSENTINIYSFPTSVSLGHIASITNGYNKTTTITYEKGTNPSVYTLGNNATNTYPVNTYTLPIPLVSNVFQTNGAAGSESVSYSYEGMKLHVQGKGLLGFTALRTDNTTLGIQTERRITDWDQTRWVPLSVSTTTTNAGQVSSANSTYTISSDEAWGSNYFAYCSQTTATDYDYNQTRTTITYDTTRGVPTEECTYYGNNTDMYKKKEYTWTGLVCGKYLPSAITSTQKHCDDVNVYTVTDSYTYNAKGDVVRDVTTSQYKGQTVVLTTNYTRDTYGNVTEEQSLGNQVTGVTKYTQYDIYGLRKIREYTQPSSAVTTYSYDN